MGIRSRHRVFGLRYRTSPGFLTRESTCNCDRPTDDVHHVGDIWHEEIGNALWVYLAVEDFDDPRSQFEHDRVDSMFQRSELAAENWIGLQYPLAVLK